MQVADAHRVEEKSRQKSILAIAEAADEHARRLGATLSLPEPEIRTALVPVYDKTSIEGVVKALSGLPVHEVGSRDGVLALLSLTEQFASLGVAVEAYMNFSHDPHFLKMYEEFAPDQVGDREKAVSDYVYLHIRNLQVRVGKVRADYASLKQAIDRDPI